MYQKKIKPSEFRTRPQWENNNSMSIIPTSPIMYNVIITVRFVSLFFFTDRSCGNQLSLEVYNKTTTANRRRNQPPPRSASTPGVLSLAAAAVSQSDTTVSLQEPPRRRFHIPQVTFTSEVGSGVVVWYRFAIYYYTYVVFDASNRFLFIICRFVNHQLFVCK